MTNPTGLNSQRFNPTGLKLATASKSKTELAQVTAVPHRNGLVHYSEMSTLPMQRKSGLGCLMQIVLVLVVCGVLMMAVTALLTPWAFYMGGRFHLLPYWQGWGRLHSNSAGGDYAVYIYIYPKTGRGLGTTHLTGNALLCTPRGEKFSLRLGGDFQKGTRRDTNGRTAIFYMSPYTLKSQFTSQYQRPELELRGRWSNPDLVLDDHGSIARNFTSDAQVRTSLNGVPYMKEVSPITLHEGTKSDFDAACAAVKQ